MTTSLPSPRTFLTSLVNTLASSSPSTSSSASDGSGGGGGGGGGGSGSVNVPGKSSSTSNPLKQLAGPHRALLTTLHVLYPSVLLPALDVLDRRLVTRVYVVEEGSTFVSNPVPASTIRKQGLHAAGGGGSVATGGNTGSGLGVKGPDEEQPPPELPPSAASSSPNARAVQAEVVIPSEEGHGNGNDNGKVNTEDHTSQTKQQQHQEEEQPTFHIVRSAQQPQSLRRNHHHHGNAGMTASPRQTYVVRLRPWSCTCAAFAFAAYPFEGSSSSTFGSGSSSGVGPSRRGGYSIEPPFSSFSHPQSHGGSRPGFGRNTTATTANLAGDQRDGAGKTDIEWEFGGLSIDGKVRVQGGEGAIGIAAGVPACKHLLACVLAERLGAGGTGLGAYVDERRVGREEGAGLVGDV